MRQYLCFLLLFFSNWTTAQPDTHIGCRHANQQAHRYALTPEMEARIQASAERSDTIDILDYSITLDVTDFSGRSIQGDCVVTFAPKMDNINYLNLDLQTLTVDSVLMDDAPIPFTHNGLLLRLDFPMALNIGESYAVQVFYGGMPDTDPSDFGGFDFQNGYAYNLGIGLTSNPPNFGRSWFPCFDNFVERSTYEFNITSQLPNRAYCVGSFIEEVNLDGNLVRRTYQLAQPIPTYLASVAVSSYAESNGMHEGQAAMIPTQLVAKQEDIEAMAGTFVDLGKAIDALEYWYGPYAWERVGYVATPVGAMEHPTNIAYPVSIAVGGNTFGHRRLMAHELAHCWWGDVVTIGSARDMWIKEGNAEYGAHLMTEYTFGKEAFLDQVKDNHLYEVLISAHRDDDGFHPLSQIPFEYIYGTHTYRKGAAMLHNMRGYLGDSLFQVGQRAVLEAFAYASADAIQYRDKLTEATGYDMTSFFEDWILNPGFSAFEPQYSYIENGGMYAVDLVLTQKVREAPHLHTNVPLEITFTDAAGNKDTQRVMASGATTNLSLSTAVEPVYVTVNENNTLNMAHLSYQTVLEEADNINLPYVEFELNVNELPNPTFLHVDHYWVAPDPIQNNPDNAQISSTHYWRVLGDLDNGIQAGGILEYNEILDTDLTENGEEDIILVYRPNKNADWYEYPYYNKLTLNPSDGNGFIRMQQLLQGEYAFANGTLPLYTSTEETAHLEQSMRVYPNPTQDILYIDHTFDKAPNRVLLQLMDSAGKTVFEETLQPKSNRLTHQLMLENIPAGTYFLSLQNETQQPLGSQVVEVLR